MRKHFSLLILFFFFGAVLFAQEKTDFKIKKEYTEDGINITAKAESKGFKVYYRLYNSRYESKAKGSIRRRGLFVPYDTEVCLWAQNRAGERSAVKYFVAKKADQENIIQVNSPKSGVWNEKQMLIIDADADTQVMYSVNGHDPEDFGLLYTEPILIEESGKISLWIKAISADGTIAERKIAYSVDKSGASSPDVKSKTEKKFHKSKEDSVFKLLSWHFVEFKLDKPIQYLIQEKFADELPKEKLLQKYDAPIFLERDKDLVLYWVCEGYNDGNINKIEFPKMPKLSGCPDKPTNQAVELKFDDDRYDYFFIEEMDSAYTYSFDLFKNLNDLDLTELNLSKFTDGKFSVDIPANQKKDFVLRIPVFYKGLYQGSFTGKFKIDKLAPKAPNVSFAPNFSPANTPVNISLASSEGEVVTEITPPIYKKEKNKIILSGDEDKAIDYSVNIYTLDNAGNKSRVIRKNITVYRNAIFVDSNSESKNPNGNPSNPYSSPHAALKHINEYAVKNKSEETESWKVYLRGNFILNEALLITKNMKFIATGKRTSIRFTKNTGFVVNNANFELENCDVFRKEYKGEPRSVPLIYMADSTVKLNGVNLRVIEGQSVVNAFSSHLYIANTKIRSKQSSHCTVINLDNSSAVFENLSFTASGSSVLGISASESNIELTNVKSTLKTNFTARFLQAWNSQIVLGKINCLRQPENERNKDCAVWYNRRSKLDLKFNPIIRGYSKSIQREQ